MIAFREVDDADPALAFSPMVRGVEKTFAWIGEHGGIPLTPSKAFKRVFVHWEATEAPVPCLLLANPKRDLFKSEAMWLPASTPKRLSASFEQINEA